MEENRQNQRAEGGSPPDRLGEGHTPHGRMLPVWFFVGIILLVYGIIILITGLTELHHPPPTVLAAELHPTLWWGIILTVLGGFFIICHGPWRRRS
jgi:hypothetical protein